MPLEVLGAAADGMTMSAATQHLLHKRAREPSPEAPLLPPPPPPQQQQQQQQQQEAQQQEEQQEKQPAKKEDSSPLDGASGVDELLAAGFTLVFDKSALAAPGGAFPSDHIFRALVASGLIKDERVFFKAPAPAPAEPTAAEPAEAATMTTTAPLAVLVGAYALGPNGCGHAGITHGGLTAALFDESIGELLYIAKMQGLMKFKYVVTASLEVAYKKPWSPAQAPAYVTAWVSEVQGRKIWVEAAIADRPLTGTGTSAPEQLGPAASPLPCDSRPLPTPPEGATVYATAKALFLEPRPEGSSSAALNKAAEGRPDQLLGGSA